MTSDFRSRLLLFVSYFLLGIVVWVVPIFLFASHLHFGYQVCLTLLLFTGFLVLRSHDSQKAVTHTIFAFFVASFVYFLAINFGGGSTIESKVINLVISTGLVVPPILLFNHLAGDSLSHLYLQVGNLKLGLLLGGSTLLFFIFTAIPASLLFGAASYGSQDILSWLPGITIFIFANAVREELWFRGLFLKKFQIQFSEDTSNLLQALIFSLAHLTVPLTDLSLILLVVTFLLGLGFAAVIQKTDSLLAAVLFHAGADIPVVIAAFSLVV